VAPGAMVLGLAKVLDNASVEEYAIVKGNAQLSGSARVGGQAIIGGTTSLSGYQRAWLPDAATDNGLWQNYALDEASVMMLEDRYHSHGTKNGYVCGAPKLVVDGERRGFRFNGKTQYLDLNARAADMGQITVDMAVRPAGGRQQTLFDFGSDVDNCMTLKMDASGKPVFTATVTGKTVVALPMRSPLAKGTWTRLRVEIDGKTISLWANDKLSVSKASTFRPADAFPAGLQKRNFVAASREGKEHFAGAIDFVVIYHDVHGAKFIELPPPIIDASRRPTQQFATELIKDSAARHRYSVENKRASDEALLYYNKLAEDVVIRLHELRNRDPNWPKAIAKAKKELADIVQSANAQPKKELPVPAKLTQLKTQRAALQKERNEKFAEKEKRVRQGEAEWLKTVKDQEYLKLMAEQQAIQNKVDAMAKELEAGFETMPEEVQTNKAIVELTAERAKLGDVVEKVNEEVAAAVAKMPVYWDSKKISEENRFLGNLRVQYDGEHDRSGGASGKAIQGYRTQQERRKQMAKNPAYKRAVEIDRELEVLKTLSPVHRKMYFATAKEYNEICGKLRGENSPGHKANQIITRLKEEQQQKMLGPDYAPMQAKRKALDNEIRALQRDYDEKRRQHDQIARRAQEVRREEIKRELFKAYNKAVEPYHAEYHNGVSYLRSALRGFYNNPYSYHFRDKGLVRKTYRYRDVPGGVMQTAIDAYQPENWKTDVRAWDWRTRWERDGTLSQFPMTQKWLKRVRGDAPVNVVE
jgi:hypothetical protein